MMRHSLIPTLIFGLVACGSSSPGDTEMPASNENMEAASETTSNAAPVIQDIVDTAVSAGSFTKLAAALEAAELIETLKGEGPFTVFAPTDAAFDKLPTGALEALLADKEKLIAVLTYHVVAGKVMAADVANITEATTVQGGTLSVDTSNGVVIGGAAVTQADIEATNGVIHVIDTVLLPAE